jgi:ribonuclease D
MTDQQTPPLPTKEEINLLETFDVLGINDVVVVTNAQQAEQVFADLNAAGVVGFDTESKPTFRVGEESTGPHVVQFASLHKGYIFQVHVAETYATLMAILESEDIKKVGFGLGGDMTGMSRRFAIQPCGIIDLNSAFSAMGYRKTIGARQAVALLFKKRFIKSKKISTSNWANPVLNERQVLYAANDAWVAVCVYQALQVK